MKKQHLAVASLITVTAIALTGCSTSGSGAAGEESSGGRLGYVEAQAWNTLYPPSAGFYPNGAVVNQVTDRLLYQNPETLELEPWIASELPEVNDDATEYTFTLREGVTYSDGTPLDAENVVKNIDLFAKGDTDRGLAPSEAIANFVSAEVVDEHTVKFSFSEPAPGFPQGLSTINSGLLSNATLERTGDEFGPGNATEIVGSGPFVVSDEQLNSSLAFDAREDYDWAPPSLAHQGRAEIDGIDLTVAEESSVRVGTVISGQADIARQIPVPDEAQFTADGFEIVAAPTNGVNNSLNFRFGHPLLSDVRVREAIIAGVDREEIVSTLFSDSYPVATGVLATTALGYLDTSGHYVYDQTRAKELLDEAGWAPGADGIREKDGVKLVLGFNEALPLQRSREVITLIQAQLAAVGIGVELFPGDQAAQNAAKDDIDSIQVYHQLVGRADYEVLKSQFFSTNRNVLLNSDPATQQLRDAELDALLGFIASGSTNSERQAASETAQEYLATNAYVLPLFEEPLVYGLRSTVAGFNTEAVGRPSFYSVSLNA